MRGGAALLLAKVVHVLASFGLYFFLAWVLQARLGEAAAVAAFGAFGAGMAVVNPLNTTAAQGALQVTSRFVAVAGGDPDGAFRHVLRLQMVAALLFVAVWMPLAPLLATGVLGDAALTPLLRLGGLVPPLYLLRCAWQGWCNGTRRFAAQSWIDVGSSLLRSGLVLGGAALLPGALGAMGGVVAGAAVVLVGAALLLRPGPARGAPRPRLAHVLDFGGKVLLLTLVTQCLLNLDILVVKRFGAADPAIADRLAGYTTGALKIAQIPWSVVIALAWVLFPVLAAVRGRRTDGDGGRASVPGSAGGEAPAGGTSSTAAGGAGDALPVLRQGLRTALLLLVPAAALLGGSADATYRLVFPGHAQAMATLGDDPTLAARVLAIHGPAYVVLTLLVIGALLLTAVGRPGLALALLSGTLLLAAALAALLVRPFGPPGVALGSALAWTAGLAATLPALATTLGLRLPLASTARILGCGALVFAAARLLPGQGLALLAEDAGLALLYLLLLLASRETSAGELRTLLREIAGRRA